MYPALLLLGLLASVTPNGPAAATTTTTSASGRIYLAPLRAAAGIDETTRQLIEDAVLVAARQRDPRVIGSADLAVLLDVEATQQAMGCSTTGCDAELADALGAPELLSGQLSRVDDTWVLSMSHLEREALTVLGRHQVSRTGTSGTVLLAAIPELVDALFGTPAPPSSPLTAIGAVTAGVGVGVAAVGGGLYLASYLAFVDGKKAVDDDDLPKAAATRKTWEPVSNASIVVAAVGAAGVVVGAVVYGIGIASEQP